MLRHDADRNLLFGINALQNDFITRDALIAAMNAWALEKHRPIGEILVERGDLDPADREALEAMVARRLAKHGDDPAASLAALSSAGSVARRSADRSPTPTSRNRSIGSPARLDRGRRRPSLTSLGISIRPASAIRRSATTPREVSESSSSPATRS